MHKLDGRTKQARRIAKIQKLIHTDLSAAAVQILERDIAYLSTYAETLVKNDMNSKSVKSLPHFLKVHLAMKGALAALQKVQGSKKKGLANLFDDDSE